MLRPCTPPAAEYRRTVNRLGWSLTAFLLMFFVLYEGFELIFGLLTSDSHIATAVYSLLSSVAYMAPFLLSGWFFYLFSASQKNKPAPYVARVRFEVRQPAIVPLLILAGLGINLVATYLNAAFCEAIGYVLPPDAYTPSYDEPWSVVLFMTTALAPAFAEEFLFRGVVYGNLRPYGRVSATLISAAAFALMHQNIAQLFYTFICGLILAIMYEWTGSLWCSIFFHLFNNELAVLTESLLYGRYGESAEPFLFVWDIVVVVLGAISTVILILYARQTLKARREATGIFGTTESIPEMWSLPLNRHAVGRGLCSPGMITFTVITLLSIVSGMMSIWFYNVVGGFM